MADEETATAPASGEGGGEGSSEQKPVEIHRLYKYHLQNFEMLAPDFDGPIDMVPGSVQMLYIDKNYDEAIYPLFCVTMAINPKIREYIAMRKNEISFLIRLQCDIFDSNSASIDPESSEDVFNTIFIPVIDDNVPFWNAQLYNETDAALKQIASNGGSVDDLGGANMTADHKEIHTYYFYVERDLYNSKDLINDVYNGANLPTICADMLGKHGFDGVLMSPADNPDAISQCIIPPMSLLNLFGYLTENYGLHVTGTTTFFDYRCVYILNKSGHPNCVEEGEYPVTIFDVHGTHEAEHYLPGTITIDELKEYHIDPDPKNIIMKDPSALNDHLSGNNLIMINSKENSSSKIQGTGRQRGAGNTRVGNNTNYNDYNKTEYANKVSEQNLSVMFTLYDVFMWALTPNKEFIVNIMTDEIKEEYNGYYRPTRTQFIFNKDGESLALQANHFMVKKEDISKQVEESKDVEVAPGGQNANNSFNLNAVNNLIQSFKMPI